MNEQRAFEAPPTTRSEFEARARASEGPGAASEAGRDERELISFLAGRSQPCPVCGYNLRDIQSARCPECGEALVLKVGTPRAKFGWLLVAMAPGCFSGVAAMFVLVPIMLTVGRTFPPGQGLPWPVVAADIFGFLSAGSVGVMYWKRQRIMVWRTSLQAAFAAAVWTVHVLAFALFLIAMLQF